MYINIVALFIPKPLALQQASETSLLDRSAELSTVCFFFCELMFECNFMYKKPQGTCTVDFLCLQFSYI